MIGRRLTSLVATLCLLFAAAVSLAQTVAVAATHVQHDVQMLSIAEQGHVHGSDMADHDPADHAHDVSHEAALVHMPVMTWSAKWTRQGSLDGPSTGPRGCERPPRPAVAS
jgi:hypothetical protein